MRIIFLLFLASNIHGQIKEIQIGDQVWMTENLKVNTFRDGTPIPKFEEYGWHNLTTPAYCWYDNDSTKYGEPYGKLYNYYAIQSGKLCPLGWRIPTITDYRKLVIHLDIQADTTMYLASEVVGGMLKSDEQSHWDIINVGATNESGFEGLFGGCRAWNSTFSAQNGFGYYGCVPNEGVVAIRWATPRVFVRDKISKYVGVSVRCIKIYDDESPSIPENLKN